MPTYLLVCQHEARTFLCLNKVETFLADSVYIYDTKTAGIKSSTHSLSQVILIALQQSSSNLILWDV